MEDKVKLYLTDRVHASLPLTNYKNYFFNISIVFQHMIRNPSSPPYHSKIKGFHYLAKAFWVPIHLNYPQRALVYKITSKLWLKHHVIYY